MSQQSNQLVSKALEVQQRTIESGQEAVQQAVELPLNQAVEFQKNAAQLFKNGLEMGTWAQHRGIELTNEALDNYIGAVERTARNTEALAEAGVETAGANAWQGAAAAADAGYQAQQAVAQPNQYARPMNRSGHYGQPAFQGDVSRPPAGQVPNAGAVNGQQQPTANPQQTPQPQPPTQQPPTAQPQQVPQQPPAAQPRQVPQQPPAAQPQQMAQQPLAQQEPRPQQPPAAQSEQMAQQPMGQQPMARQEAPIQQPPRQAVPDVSLPERERNQEPEAQNAELTPENA